MNTVWNRGFRHNCTIQCIFFSGSTERNIWLLTGVTSVRSSIFCLSRTKLTDILVKLRIEDLKFVCLKYVFSLSGFFLFFQNILQQCRFDFEFPFCEFLTKIVNNYYLLTLSRCCITFWMLSNCFLFQFLFSFTWLFNLELSLSITYWLTHFH